MKLAGVLALLLASALAGLLSAIVLADPTIAAVFQTGSTSTTTTSTAPTTTAPTTTGTTGSTTGTTGSTTTRTTTTTPTTTTTRRTTTAPTTTAPRPRPRPPAKPVTIARRVSIAGVRVGGLTPASARQVVRAHFVSPLVLTYRGRTFRRAPASFGTVAYVEGAVARARLAVPGSSVPLVVRLRGDRVREYVARLAGRFDRTAVDARLSLRGTSPHVSASRDGRALDRLAATKAIVAALAGNSRRPIALSVAPVRASVTREGIGSVLVIQRASNQLALYDGMRLRRTFRVATGQSRYPTPLGRFSVVVMWRNPWWYPPSSDWAEGLKPVPPGPGNPLGTRWIGISSPGVGIHGTPDSSSIGYSVSHGCIRMHIPDVEWLFTQLQPGATVFIVDA